MFIGAVGITFWLSKGYDKTILEELAEYDSDYTLLDSDDPTFQYEGEAVVVGDDVSMVEDIFNNYNILFESNAHFEEGDEQW